MNLSIKQKALFQTFGLLASALIAGASVSLLIEYVSIGVILTSLGIGFVAYMFYLVYQINLSQLQYKETLKEIVDKK